jgi:alpha,alpha-trehalase
VRAAGKGNTVNARYPPHVLSQYALLADGERGAVIGPRGDVSWMCVPHWDSPAVFAGLVGGAGVYAISPAERHVPGGYYEAGTLIWHSRWITTAGIIECREALAYPADPHRAVLLRRVYGVNGDAAVEVSLSPHAEYGAAALRPVRRQDDCWVADTGGLRLRWSGAAEARPVGRGPDRRLELTAQIPAGTYRDFVLEISDQKLPDALPDPDELWRQTASAWQAAVPEFPDCLTPRDTRQSYAVLRGLTSREGGMVAAATTSLPERAEAGRNYDYRYVWIRDQCYAGRAVSVERPDPLLDDAVRFVTHRLLEHGDRMAPAYTITGERVPDQRQLGLDGYPGGYDIVGNWVNGQFQLDAFGESLLLLATAARHDRLDSEGRNAAEVAAETIAKRWTEPDAGIWEIEPQAWTHSRLTAVAGLRALAGMDPTGKGGDWLKLADRILADTAAHATAPGGHWQRSPDDAGLDAALLLPPLRGALPADDPRTVATLAAYRDALTRDGYAYRFRQDDRPLGDAEGSFLLCGFVMALATHQQGNELEALGWFERTRLACGPPHLFSEEFDISQHQLRGNLPQAFVHALMVEASIRLSRGLPAHG